MSAAVPDSISDETELIQTYLAPLASGMPGAFGLADDAALIETEAGVDLVVSTDPIIAGVHFFADDDPEDVAWKALAVNVSDLAAKGAEPFAYTLALAFPDAPRRDWMARFSKGLGDAQTAFGCKLIGGDTDRTPGPLSIGVTAFGNVPRGRMVTRAGAKAGDHVFVSGSLGDAALGLLLRRNPQAFGDALDEAHRRFLLKRYLRPLPRVTLAPLLRTYASAALDVSDGLLKDAARLASGADSALTLRTAALPLSQAARAIVAADRQRIDAIVSGGDDYEILFAIPPSKRAGLTEAVSRQFVAITEIGVLTRGSGVTLLSVDGAPFMLPAAGYDHFRKP